MWTPDGRRVLFVSGVDLLLKAADATGKVERLAGGLAGGNIPNPYSWSRDGKSLLLTMGQPSDIHLLSIDSPTKSQPLIQRQFTELRPAISPDGRWMAYQSNESGRNEVYVQPFPDVNRGRWQISTDGGDSPLWSPDGRWLFYRRGAQASSVLMAVAVESGQAFTPGTPSVVFEGTYVWVANRRTWDIAPDGQRFLMLKEGSGQGNVAGNIIVVQNWFEDLKRLVPTR